MKAGICYIVGAGEDFGLDFIPEKDDMVIAADGGYRILRNADICPDAVIGDFDSLGAAPDEGTVITLPKVKDITDTWAAIRFGMDRGYGRFHLYGCTGGRFDHTLANLQTVADAAALGLECCLYDRKQVITALCGGTAEFSGRHSGYVSVFSYTDRCTGVSVSGMKYELENGELTNRFPLGVSNEFTGKPSSVTVKEGIAILVYDK